MATKSKPKKRSKPKGIERSFDHNPFPAKSKVEVHDAFGISPPNAGKPVGKPVSTATVAKDGSLKVRVPKPGSYVLSGDTEQGWRRVAFRAKK